MQRLFSNKYLVLSIKKHYLLDYYMNCLLFYNNQYGRIYYEIHNIDTHPSFIIP